MDQKLQELRDKMREADTGGRLREQLDRWQVVSPYVLAQFLDVRPQLIYGYIKEGRIAAVHDNNTQKLWIEEGEALRFAHQYLERKAKRQRRLAV